MTTTTRCLFGLSAFLLGAFLIAHTIAGAPIEYAAFGIVLACVGGCAVTPEPKGIEA